LSKPEKVDSRVNTCGQVRKSLNKAILAVASFAKLQLNQVATKSNIGESLLNKYGNNLVES